MRRLDPDALDGALMADPPTLPRAASRMTPMPTATAASPPRAPPIPVPRLPPITSLELARRPSEPRRRRSISILPLSLGVATVLAAFGLALPHFAFHAPPPLTLEPTTRAPLPVVTPMGAPPKAAAPKPRHDDSALASSADPPAQLPVSRAAPLTATFPARFTFNDSAPSNLDAARWSELRARLRSECGSHVIQVIGHTCNRGSDAANRRISARRADAVAQLLVAEGFAESRISIDGRGSAEPIANNHTEEGRIANRRVVIACQSEPRSQP